MSDFIAYIKDAVYFSLIFEDRYQLVLSGLGITLVLTISSFVLGTLLGMGLCGFLAGLVFHRGGLPRKREALCAYGAVSAFLVYGILLNAYSALLATGALTWQSLAVYCASGFAMDAVQAISTVIFLWFFTEPMLDKLERVKIKYGFA